MEVNLYTIPTTTFADTATRSGFYDVAEMDITGGYLSNCNLLSVASTDGGTLAFHLMDEALTDFTTFHAPEPTTILLITGGGLWLFLRKKNNT